MTTEYVSEQQLLDYIKSTANTGNEAVQMAIDAAQSAVNAHCARTFEQVTADRYFSPEPGAIAYCVYIDDLASVTGLTVHTDTGAGTYPTSLTLNTDFRLEPVNQTFGGIGGWPYTRMRAIAGGTFPLRTTGYQPDTVKVHGVWGWPAVPDAVKRATLIIAAQYYKLMDAPLGVAGWGAYGDIRVRDVPQASTLLVPYRKGTSFGVA